MGMDVVQVVPNQSFSRRSLLLELQQVAFRIYLLPEAAVDMRLSVVVIPTMAVGIDLVVR